MKKFLDTVKVKFKSGNGGQGVTVFFQDWMQKKKHPHGGDGGRGGNIVLVANAQFNTLSFFQNNEILNADNGGNGGKSNRHGKNGEDLFFQVPVGTLIFDEKQKQLLFNFVADGQKFTITKGGYGGWGNATLSRKHRKPIDYSYPGTLGEEKIVVLDLRMLSEVALIGLPNVGKTSLLNVMTNAKAKIGNYTFTTLSPNLGLIFFHKSKKKILISDLPGIIEKAHLNKGLGNRFLKHTQRCYLLLHVVDLSKPKKEILHDFHLINHELFTYNHHFSQIPQVIIANKSDIALLNNNLKLTDFKYKDFVFLDFITVSSIKNTNLTLLKDIILRALDNKPEFQTVMEKIIENDPKYIPVHKYRTERLIHFRKVTDNAWELSSSLIDQFVLRLNLEEEADLLKLSNFLNNSKITQRLKSEGIRDGDLVYLSKKQFVWKN